MRTLRLYRVLYESGGAILGFRSIPWLALTCLFAPCTPVSQTFTSSTSGSGPASGFLDLSGSTGYYVQGGVAILVVAGAAVALALRSRRK